MPYRRRSKRKKALRLSKKAAAIFAIFIVMLAAGILVLSSIFAREMSVAQRKPIIIAKAAIKEADVDSEIEGKYYGLCEKNSIHSVADFRKTVEQDPILANHYSGFNWDNAKIGRLEESLLTFVSYRKDDIIRRTSKPVRLPKGDEYITDGIHRVRTFCCNDYSVASAPAEVSKAEPAPDMEPVPDSGSSSFSQPDPLILAANIIDQKALLDEPAEKVTISSPMSPPTFGLYSSREAERPVVTPEPGTFWLMGCGGVAAVALVLKRRRKALNA